VADATFAGKYNFFILKAVKAWENTRRRDRRIIHANGDGTFVVGGRRRDLKSRMVKFQALLRQTEEG
jgi:hypothetical protein